MPLRRKRPYSILQFSRRMTNVDGHAIRTPLNQSHSVWLRLTHLQIARVCVCMIACAPAKNFHLDDNRTHARAYFEQNTQRHSTDSADQNVAFICRCRPTSGRFLFCVRVCVCEFVCRPCVCHHSRIPRFGGAQCCIIVILSARRARTVAA